MQFEFDHVFGPTASNRHVYSVSAKHLVEAALAMLASARYCSEGRLPLYPEHTTRLRSCEIVVVVVETFREMPFAAINKLPTSLPFCLTRGLELKRVKWADVHTNGTCMAYSRQVDFHSLNILRGYKCTIIVVQGACNGGVGTLFMFGQTGSGKTHTMTAIEDICRALLATKRTEH
eukprot:4380821-Amphidinium_carterae.2